MLAGRLFAHRLRPFLVLLGVAVLGCGARTELSVEEERGHFVNSDGGVTCSEGPRILFSHRTDLYVMNADGSERRRVNVPDSMAGYPTVSPSARFFAYVPILEDQANREVVVIDLLRGTSDRLVLGISAERPGSSSNVTYPRFSPDESMIAYADGVDVRVARRDGTNIRTLIEGPLRIGASRYGYGHPIFLSDDKIVWTTAGQSGVINLDGSERRTLLVSDLALQPFFNPTLSPDGSTLAFLNSCEGTRTFELRLYPFDSLPAECPSGRVLLDGLRNITNINRSPNPSWGPSDLIAFTQDRDLFVVSAAGGVPTNLTEDLTGDGEGGLDMALDAAWVPGCTSLP